MEEGLGLTELLLRVEVGLVGRSSARKNLILEMNTKTISVLQHWSLCPLRY